MGSDSIDAFRDLIADYDELVASKNAAVDRAAELEKRVAELEAQQKLKLIFADSFSAVPVDGSAGGLYTLDVPDDNCLKAIPEGLRVSCSTNQPLDRNKTRRRSEIALWEPGSEARKFRRTKFGVEEWFAVSTRFPSPTSDTAKAVFLNWHAGESDPLEILSRPAPLSFQCWDKANRLRIIQCASTEEIQKSNPPFAILWEDSGMNIQEWHRWVVRVVFHWDAKQKPLLQIWLDGKPIVEQYGIPNCYRDKEEFLFNKFGCYLPNATEEEYSPPLTHTHDFARLRIAGPGARLEDMS